MKFSEIQEISNKFITDQNLVREDVVDFVFKLTGKNILETAVKKQRQPSQESIDRLQSVRGAVESFQDNDKFSVKDIMKITNLEKTQVQYAVSQLQKEGTIFISGAVESKGTRGKKPSLYSKVISE